MGIALHRQYFFEKINTNVVTNKPKPTRKYPNFPIYCLLSYFAFAFHCNPYKITILPRMHIHNVEFILVSQWFLRFISG